MMTRSTTELDAEAALSAEEGSGATALTLVCVMVFFALMVLAARAVSVQPAKSHHEKARNTAKYRFIPVLRGKYFSAVKPPGNRHH